MSKTCYVKVQFDGSAKKYQYLAEVGVFEIDDFVVVPPNDFTVYPSVAKVCEVTAETAYTGGKTKFVIHKVDFDKYLRRLELDKKRATILKALEAKREEAEGRAIYEILAKENPEMAELLEKLDGLEDE